ncbi:MAG TPA: hypothetical protein VL625_13385 [Patescibacteria group bacterium]|nr:hypothetical protein [Patescibacteria group bacterium]
MPVCNITTIDAALANDVFEPISKSEICDEVRAMLAERAMHSIAYIHQI